MNQLFEALEKHMPARLNEPLSRHTTIGIGGAADVYARPRSAEELALVLNLSQEAGVNVFVLGSGSNIVVGDLGMRGVTIENNATLLTGPVEEPEAESTGSTVAGQSRVVFRAESGASFASVSRQLSFAGHKGMEWACGIPGTIGGAVVYNAGAYGGCLGDVLLRVCVWDHQDGEHVLEAEELGLIYRGSAFTRGLMAGRAVLWAEFALWPGDPDELRSRIAEYDQRRLQAQPRGRNAGSFFKNPPDQPAWKLLDAVGMRGYRVGGAEFSSKHCNFLVNAGGAKASDVATLRREAQSRVYERFGVQLDNEVTFVGEGFEP